MPRSSGTCLLLLSRVGMYAARAGPLYVNTPTHIHYLICTLVFSFPLHCLIQCHMVLRVASRPRHIALNNFHYILQQTKQCQPYIGAISYIPSPGGIIVTVIGLVSQTNVSTISLDAGCVCWMIHNKMPTLEVYHCLCFKADDDVQGHRVTLTSRRGPT
jgi:hypothetical protein